MKLFETKRKILIKTFCFESGLYYLGESLYRQLLNEGHEVRFIPKARYVKDGTTFFRRIYPEASNPEELPPGIVMKFTENQTTDEQILKYCIKFDIDTIISLETLMEKSNWINFIKRRKNVQVIDVPMIEWVGKKFIQNGSYKIFDDVWTLTNQAHQIFDSFGHPTKRVSWNFVDQDLFFPDPDPDPMAPPYIQFYHAASLNSDFSSKNTDLVMSAFDKALTKCPGIKLTITGKISDKKLLNIIEKNHTNIKIIDGVLNRKQLSNLYKNMNCVIAPSSKEGLGLSLYEAQACGCNIITTDIAPMNEHSTKYLCQVNNTKADGTLVPKAELTMASIYEQILKVYEDNKSWIL